MRDQVAASEAIGIVFTPQSKLGVRALEILVPAEPCGQERFNAKLVSTLPAPRVHTDGGDGGAGESRTRDKRFRKPLLYPSELQPLVHRLLQLLQPTADWTSALWASPL